MSIRERSPVLEASPLMAVWSGKVDDRAETSASVEVPVASPRSETLTQPTTGSPGSSFAGLADLPERPTPLAELDPAGLPRRSTHRQARAKLDAYAERSVEGRIWIAENARDESVKLRALEGLSAAAGLSAPSVQVHAHVIVDQREALADLERIMSAGSGEALDVASVELVDVDG